MHRDSRLLLPPGEINQILHQSLKPYTSEEGNCGGTVLVAAIVCQYHHAREDMEDRLSIIRTSA